MIYTVTFNPALDYVVQLEKLHLGEVNRTREEQIYYGGKGINVSIVLKNMGIESTALGFLAGFTGKEIERGLKAQGISTDFYTLPKGLSRINVKIKGDQETDINGCGPVIDDEALKSLLKQIGRLSDGDTLVLAGSIPAEVSDDIYEQILASLEGKTVRTVVDAEKKLLVNVLKYHPFLIKPNHYELGEIFDASCTNEDEIIYYVRKLQKMGARNVLVSRAGDGALLVTEDGSIYRMEAPEGKVKNSVGAGDSMVAGFLAGSLKSGDYKTALYYGVAAGSASAFSEGLADWDTIRLVLDSLSAKGKLPIEVKIPIDEKRK